MSVYNAKTIDTDDVAQRLIDALSDFHNEGLISGATLRSKINYTNILKAINAADREVCRDSQIHRLVVVYAPPGHNTILFDQNDQYTREVFDAINEAGIPDWSVPYFINKHDYINVVEIFSRYIELFSTYPTGGEQATTHIRKVGPSELRQPSNTKRMATNDYIHQTNTNAEFKASFIPDENRLLLDHAIEGGGFLRFEGRILPGVLNTAHISESHIDAQEYHAYKIVAPHHAHEFLVGAAIYHSLPISSRDARGIAFESMAREKRDYLKMKPMDSNVVIPTYHI